jgi:hypothetical protein
MSSYADRNRARAIIRPFWKNNAFWIVVMPTSLVAAVFLLGMITEAFGQ